MKPGDHSIAAHGAETEHFAATEETLASYRIASSRMVVKHQAEHHHQKHQYHNFDKYKRVPDYDVPLTPPPSGPLKFTPGAAEVIELKNLKNHSAAHKTPDAVVRIPENFDPTKPIHVLVYNHGWYDNVSTSYKGAHVEDAMANAPPNTVLVMPEWQANAGAASSRKGNFGQHNLFQNMLSEIFQKVPRLQGNTLKDIDTIDIVSHSAGYVPTEDELYENDIGKRATSVTLLDSLYDDTGLDKWIQNNLSDLASGKKQFNNVYFGTRKYSELQTNRIKQMLNKAGLSSNALWVDSNADDSESVVDSSVFTSKSIVLKYSRAKVDDLDAHMSLPNMYIGTLESAIKARRYPPVP